MRKVYLFIVLIALVEQLHSQSIIPLPQKIEKRKGTFQLNRNTRISVDATLRKEVDGLIRVIADRTGYTLATGERPEKLNTIQLTGGQFQIADGGYELDITPEKISIRAKDAEGAFYGCMSLLQLLPAGDLKKEEASYAIEAIKITDYPRFKWRGLMLDCSRTFIPPSYLKRTIDRMAFYKMNRLHWHLTDDQGWRMEMKSRPLLTEKSSTFPAVYHEPAEFQGFYSQDDIKELLAYAAERHVEIIPEIECPGHNQAALFAYPDLSCTNDIKPLFPLFHGDIITAEVFCVGNPDIGPFFNDVITETAGLFPSNYLHLGGDEVPRNHWEKCPKCQNLIKTNVVKDTEALQGYFMNKVGEYAVKSGKRPVAWDEILEDKNGYISKDWIIMSWRDFTGKNPAIEAIQRGHDVVLTPTSCLYFDYPYETTDTKKIFNYDPFEGIEAGADQQHVLGIQANFWSHIDRTQARIDYQLFPRALALAERAWSSAADTDYENFKVRKNDHLSWLTYMEVIYNKISDK